MKKLMIAAATAAMIGGAFATDCGDGCNVNIKVIDQDQETITVAGCQVTAYSVKFCLKSLAAKGVKTGDCQGYCMEQGNRTLEGLLWSCCTQCQNWGDGTQVTNVGGDEEPFQYCLWEKSNKLVFSDGLAHQNAGTVTNVTTTYTYNGTVKTYTGAFAQASDFIYEDQNAASIAYQKLYDKGEAMIGTVNFAATVTGSQKYGYEFAKVWTDGIAATTNFVNSGYVYDIENKAKDAANDAINAVYLQTGYAAYTVATDAEGNKYATFTYADRDNTLVQDSGLSYAWYVTTGAQTLTGEGNSKDAAKAKAVASFKYMTVDEIKAFNKKVGRTVISEAELDIAYVGETYTETKTSTPGESNIAAWYDTDANIQVYRFSKKANKAEALWTIDTANECGHDNAIEGEYANVNLVAAGFGTTKTADGEIIVSSLSGNCAGMIEPIALTDDCDGNVCDMCIEFTSWCTDGIASTIENTFASGTWTMKYLSKLTFTKYVPAWAIDYGSL